MDFGVQDETQEQGSESDTEPQMKLERPGGVKGIDLLPILQTEYIKYYYKHGSVFFITLVTSYYSYFLFHYKIGLSHF